MASFPSASDYTNHESNGTDAQMKRIVCLMMYYIPQSTASQVITEYTVFRHLFRIQTLTHTRRYITNHFIYYKISERCTLLAVCEFRVFYARERVTATLIDLQNELRTSCSRGREASCLTTRVASAQASHQA